MDKKIIDLDEYKWGKQVEWLIEHGFLNIPSYSEPNNIDEVIKELETLHGTFWWKC